MHREDWDTKMDAAMDSLLEIGTDMSVDVEMRLNALNIVTQMYTTNRVVDLQQHRDDLEAKRVEKISDVLKDRAAPPDPFGGLFTSVRVIKPKPKDLPDETDGS